MNSIWFFALLGGGFGALLGYFNHCRSGAGPATAHWRRGAVTGALLGGLFCFESGCGGNSAAMNQSTANVKHITQAEFATEVTQAKLPVVVDCYATWCGPCRQLAPIVDNLADQYAGKIKFVKVNVDESPKVAQQFNIEGIPTLLFFNDGKLASTSVGLLAKEDLVLRLETLLKATAAPAAPAH